MEYFIGPTEIDDSWSKTTEFSGHRHFLWHYEEIPMQPIRTWLRKSVKISRASLSYQVSSNEEKWRTSLGGNERRYHCTRLALLLRASSHAASNNKNRFRLQAHAAMPISYRVAINLFWSYNVLVWFLLWCCCCRTSEILSYWLVSPSPSQASRCGYTSCPQTHDFRKAPL
jgi:hypothetical protein